MSNCNNSWVALAYSDVAVRRAWTMQRKESLMNPKVDADILTSMITESTLARWDTRTRSEECKRKGWPSKWGISQACACFLYFFIFNVRGAHSLDKKNWSLFDLYVCLESSSPLCALCHFLAKFWSWLLLTWVMLTFYIFDMVALIYLCPVLGISQFFWRICAGDRKIFGYHHGLYWCRDTSLLLLLIVDLLLLCF